MAAISICLPDSILEEADDRAREMHISRAEYLRRAIKAFNAEAAAEHRRRRIMKASYRVREDSMRINAEFDAIEGVPDVASVYRRIPG